MLFNNIAASAILGFFSVSFAAPTKELLKAPVKRQSAITDVDIAQFALTLEHLENVFYKKAVSTWPLSVFEDNNYTLFFYDQVKYIAHDEEAHVVALEALISAAGADPVQACNYTFPPLDWENVQAFLKTASIIEGVGVSAYLGAAGLITDKSILTAAGSILVTEAIHQSALRNSVGEIPMANVFGTPMGANAVYSIASTFIDSCPDTNAPLPFHAYPPLDFYSGLPTASSANPDAEVDVTAGYPVEGPVYGTFVSGLDIVAVEPSKMDGEQIFFLVPENIGGGPVYGTFVSGLDIVAVEPSKMDGEQIFFLVPENIGGGQSYMFLTNDDSGSLTDDTIIAGPVIIEITPNAPTFDLTIQ